MSPIYIILYAVLVTLVITLLMPRLRTVNPKYLWAAVIVGVGVLAGLMIVMVFSR